MTAIATSWMSVLFLKNYGFFFLRLSRQLSLDINLFFFLSRILAIAFGFGFKMVSEVDIISLNVDLARLLGIKLAHFNEIENALFSALDFDIGVSEQKFKAKFDLIDKLCGDLWSSDSAKIAELERFSITRIPETGETDETQSNSFMTFPFLKEENETE